MFSIEKCALPENALLGRYERDGSYTDCYRTDVSTVVTHAEFINGFYTTPLFRVERLILKWAVSRPSTDADVRALAGGNAESFAAWTVEARADDQLLLCDFQSRTRSWLMVSPIEDNGDSATRLYFGSAVVPVRNTETGESRMGFGFRALLGFHRLYSIALLRSAKASLS